MSSKFFTRILKFVYLTIILIFLYLPLLVVCFFSFNEGKSTTVWKGFTLDWYLKLFNNVSLMKALGTSLTLSIIVTVLSVFIGTIVSLVLYKFRNKFIDCISYLIYIPIFAPEIIFGIAFMQIFSLLDVKFGFLTLILSHLSFCVPFIIVVVYARMKSLIGNLEEAARDLGASAWQALFHITVPELLPGIISGAALSFIMSFDDVVISFFMSGALNTTLPVKVYSMLRVGVSPEINALTTVTVVLTIICICIFYSYKDKSIKKI